MPYGQQNGAKPVIRHHQDAFTGQRRLSQPRERRGKLKAIAGASPTTPRSGSAIVRSEQPSPSASSSSHHYAPQYNNRYDDYDETTQTASTAKAASSFIPQRPAPLPPSAVSNGYDSHVVSDDDYSSHARPGGRRSSVLGAQRSSYVPGSRPLNASSSAQQTYNTRSAATASSSSSGGGGPSSSSTNRTTPPGQYGYASTSSPSRNIEQQDWYDQHRSPQVPPKRPPPPAISTSLRDLSDALPGAARSGPNSSTNSSNTSLPSASHHRQQPSYALPHHLLNDPSTAVAAGLALGQSNGGHDGWTQQQQQQQQRDSGDGPYSAGTDRDRRSNDWNAPYPSSDHRQQQQQHGLAGPVPLSAAPTSYAPPQSSQPASSSTGTVREGKSRSASGKKSGFGSFLGIAEIRFVPTCRNRD